MVGRGEKLSWPFFGQVAYEHCLQINYIFKLSIPALISWGGHFHPGHACCRMSLPRPAIFRLRPKSCLCMQQGEQIIAGRGYCDETCLNLYTSRTRRFLVRKTIQEKKEWWLYLWYGLQHRKDGIVTSGRA